MPEVIALAKRGACRFATFAMCAFGVDYEKPTTLMFTPRLAAGLQDLDLLQCTHGGRHRGSAGGLKENGVWNSAAAAAYPAELNLLLAQSMAQLVDGHRDIPPHPLVARRVAQRDPRLSFDTDSSRSASAPQNQPAATGVATNPTSQTPVVQPPPSKVPPARITTPVLSPVKVGPTTPANVRTPLRSHAPLQPITESPPQPLPLPRFTESPAPPSVKQPRWEPISSRTRRSDGVKQEAFANAAHAGAEENIGAPYPILLGPNEPWVPLSPAQFKALSAKANTPAPASPSPNSDPRNHAEAMMDDPVGWAEAEKAELKNHEENGSFTLIDRSDFEREAPGRRLVKLVWVFKRKRSGRMKARLCVQGCSQQPGADYDQTHCAAMRGTSLRLLSALAGKHGFMMRRWDFVSAYLQGSLEDGEVVYCQAPPGPYGTTGSDGKQRVWRVNKPVYGMAQAGRRWQRTLFPWLKEWGLTASESDNCVFFLRRTVKTPSGPREDTLIVGCYVDDLFILYNSNDEYSLYHQFTRDLQKRWSVDDEGDVSDLLNVEIVRSDGGVELRQTSYIEKLVSEWLPNGVPSHVHVNSTPHADNLPELVLNSLSSTDPVDPSLLGKYQSLVGSLLYASGNTRPDIAYSVGMLCRAMGKPSHDLFDAAIRVLATYITTDISG